VVVFTPVSLAGRRRRMVAGRDDLVRERSSLPTVCFPCSFVCSASVTPASLSPYTPRPDCPSFQAGETRHQLFEVLSVLFSLFWMLAGDDDVPVYFCSARTSVPPSHFREVGPLTWLVEDTPLLGSFKHVSHRLSGM